MSRTNMLRFATPTLALVLSGLIVGACATSNEEGELPPPKKQPDAAAFKDTEPTDSSGGDAVSDAAPDMGSCAPLTSETKPCGKCGKRTRTCSSSGTWNEWSTCSGEDPSAECSIDEVRAAPCGNCGTQKDTCDPTSCTWSTGVCLGEGVCASGDVESSTASCSVVGEVRTRTCTDKCAWGAYSDCTLPKGWLTMNSTLPSGFDARHYATGVWTGTDAIIWGGYGTYISPTYSRRNGALYNLSGDAWKPMSLPPTALVGRYYHSAVWTGSKMIVWGGYDYSAGYRPDGASYDPYGTGGGTADSWTMLPASPLAARQFHGAVWSTTTNEMIVWGGYGSCSATYCADGAAFDGTNWTALPPAPIAGRQRHAMVWTGSEVIIWGGQGATGNLRDGARYDPKTKIWTKFPDPPAEFDGRYDSVAVWSGKELLVWGGFSGTLVGSSYARSDGARYLPGGSWTRFTVPTEDVLATGTVATRYGAEGWFGGNKLWVFSGATGVYNTYSTSSNTALTGGGSYDPTTDKWTAMDTTSAPAARAHATVVWTGKEAIIWGGSSNASTSSLLANGGVYRP